MLTTTATTAFCLLLNATAPFPMLKSFGVFNAFIVICDYVLVITWYACTTVCLARLAEMACPPGKNWECSCCCPGKKDGEGKAKKTHRLEKIYSWLGALLYGHSRLRTDFANSTRGGEPQFEFERPAQHLTQHDMHFLNARRGVARDDDQRVGNTDKFAAVLAAKRGRDDIQCLRGLEGADHVLGIPRCRNPDGNVARFADGFDLARKDILEPEIVAARR